MITAVILACITLLFCIRSEQYISCTLCEGRLSYWELGGDCLFHLKELGDVNLSSYSVGHAEWANAPCCSVSI